MRAGVSPVMSVMKKSDEAELFFQQKYGFHYLLRIPLVYNDDIGVTQFALREFAENRLWIGPDIQGRKASSELFKRLSATFAFLQQVGERPRILRLIAANVMSSVHQFMRQATQKMCVSMVPVRTPGVRKKPEFQSRTHAATPWPAT